MALTQPIRPADGNWPTFQHWVNYATRDIGGMNAACYDAQGRRCRIGADFKRADDEKTFPISFWYGEGGQTKVEQSKSRRQAKATLKANFPWRY